MVSQSNKINPCSKLWTDLTIGIPRKEIVNCCKRSNHSNFSLEEIKKEGRHIFANGSETLAARQYWLENFKFPKGCEACSSYHPNSQYKTWNKWIDKPQSFFNTVTKKDNVHMIEINLGTLCNMTCLYCIPDVSSLWANKLGLPVNEPDQSFKELVIEKFFEYIEKDTAEIPRLQFNFLGGETTLMPEFFTVVERILEITKDRHNQSIRLHFITNLNVGPSAVQKFLSLCEKCTNVEVTVAASLENLGEKAEALREGLRFDRFEENFKTFNTSDVVNSFVVLPTMCALAVADHKVFLEYIVDNITSHRRVEDLGKSWWIVASILNDPYHLRIGILPEQYKVHIDEALTYLESFSSSNLKRQDLIETYKQHLHTVKGLIGTQRSDDFLIKVKSKFEEQGKLFNKNYLEIFPELQDALGHLK